MKTSHVCLGAFLAASCLLSNIPVATAHAVRPAVLALKELSPGRFVVRWSPPTHGEPSASDPRPRFPEHCQFESDTLINCGERGLVGAIRFDNGAAIAQVSVDIAWHDGPRELRAASGEPAVLVVSGTPRQASVGQQLELARSYATMGVQHILLGVDHLMFVVGLMLFVRSMRILLLTITAFTIAHSLTLAAAALELVQLPSGPVELCIALSILLLAVESTRHRPTWTHRAPWAVAFIFGLLHGFGFASALAEVGLPPQHAPLALVSFNIGVEAGQLMSVAIVAFAWRTFVHGRSAANRAKVGVTVVLGIASVYWCLERGLALWQTRG